jgi:hypothetical protein
VSGEQLREGGGERDRPFGSDIVSYHVRRLSESQNYWFWDLEQSNFTR